MPSHNPWLNPVEAGEIIQRAREGLPLTQDQVAEELGVDKSYISKLEGGKHHAGRSKYFPQLVRVLRLKADQIARLNPGAVVPDPHQSARDLERLGAAPLTGTYLVPVLGDVAAGGRNTVFLDVGTAEEIVDVGQELAERYGLSNLYALRVTGDSMYSERTRFSVPDGSTLIVHRELEPVRGDIVVAYIEDLDLGVVKEYGEPEDVTLSSYNPIGPIYRANQHRIRMCGVVVEVRNKPRTRRNSSH